jgi:hypothetical protein
MGTLLWGLAHNLESVEFSNGDVEDQHIGFDFAGVLRTTELACSGKRTTWNSLLEQVFHESQSCRMVIGEENP